MRTKKSGGVLSQDRIERLERIGFQWALREVNNDEAWESRFSVERQLPFPVDDH